MRLHWFMLLGLALLFRCLAFAQGTGSISGVVQDESGAVVPGANVTVTNVDTGISSTFVTDATGGYHVPSLIPGHYEVRAQTAGFETGIRRGVELTVGSDLAINIPLKVGQVAQQTVVTAEAPIVNTLNSTVGALVDATTIRDLPLNGRSFDQLIALDSSSPTFRSRGRFSTYGEVDLYTVNGANEQSNLFLIDGTEMTGAGSATQLPGGVLGKNMGVDAIQEFQVLTSNYSATYGKKAGGIINIATRSGTNQIHGTAFEYLRNSDLDARNFFDPKTIPPFKRNDFGGALGGPIKKNSSFIFGNYEGLRENLGLSQIGVVPNALAHQGFLPDPTHPGQLLTIGVNPSVVPYLNLYPLPNGPDFGDGTGQYSASPAELNNLDFFLIRFDQKISDKDFFFARYNVDQAKQSGTDTTQVSPLFYVAAGDRDQTLTLEEKRLFSPRTVNLFRAGFTRAFSTSSAGTFTPLSSSLFFGPGATTVGDIMLNGGGNVVASQGISAIGPSTPYSARAVNQFEEQYQLFHYVGAHSLQFGVQLQRNDSNANGGTAALSGSYTFGNGLTSFLQGLPTQFTGALPGNYDPTKSYRRWYFSTYIQDDYKVTRNLVLNLGVRYELLTVPTEIYNRIANFHYTFVNGARILNPTPTLGSPLYSGNHLNLAPRVGLAWDPFGNGKTSVRAGYGTFFDQDVVSNQFYLTSNAPFATSLTFTNPSFPTPFGGAANAPGKINPTTLDPTWRTPVRLQWSLGIQRQITSSSVFNIGFVGSHSYHTGRLYNANTDVPTFIQGPCSFSCSAFGQVFYPAGQPRLQPAVGNSRFVTNDATNSYNSLQTSFNQRVSHGLRYAVSFTWSKNEDQGPGIIGSYANGETGVTQDPYNAKAEWGISPYNLKYNFTTNFTYDIPWSKTGFSRTLLGGWQVGGLLTLHPGTPFTVTDGYNNSRDGNSTAPDRPNLVAGTNGVPILGGPNTYYNSSVFVAAPAGYYGNVGRNIINGPGFADIDFTVHRVISVGERLKADFRAEFLNILNHPNFDLPSGLIFTSPGVYSGSAGHVSDTVVTSRQVQFGVKFTF